MRGKKTVDQNNGQLKPPDRKSRGERASFQGGKKEKNPGDHDSMFEAE